MKPNQLIDNSLLIPTCSFANTGGWVVDSEFILTMGAPYLLAHGLGVPVEDAKTTITISQAGIYNLYAYTYNWVSPWHEALAPGVFTVKIGSEHETAQMGVHTTTWGWEYGGSFLLPEGELSLAIHDLTGFEGRCAYIFLTTGKEPRLPKGPRELAGFYRKNTGNEHPQIEGEFDFIVAGGGISGICAAVAAARSGLATALVQDRLVVGGNNSSEIRVWLGGGTNYEPFGGIGNIVGELEQKRIGHYGSANQGDLYEDENKLRLVTEQKDLTPFLGCTVIDCVTEAGMISEITVWDYMHDHIFRLSAPLFCDATGDGNLGDLSGADYETTTNGHMGVSNLWHIEKTEKPRPFPRCPWAVDLSKVEFPGRGDVKDIYGNEREFSLGCWFWESGMEDDPITCAERARDLNFRAMYGAWDTLRNIDKDYQDYNLAFCAPLAGKRESRRLLGDLVLTKADFKAPFEDGCVPTTWNFDVHYPDRRFYAAFHEGDAFLTMDCREVFEGPFFLPYRCFYSRNIGNLFMAGRDVSVSHDASGTARIMRTGGMMGEVVGYAASLCKKHGCAPRAIYESHLEEFIGLLQSIEKKEVAKVGDTIV